MQCPACQTTLIAGTHERVDLLGCPSCGGRWITYAALRLVLLSEEGARSESERAAAMAASGDAASIEHDEREPFPCPACAVPMRRYVHQYSSGIWVDSCEAHGVWLDAGELERLEAYAEAVRRGATQAPSGPDVGIESPRIARHDTEVEDVWAKYLPTREHVAANLLFGRLGMVAVDTVRGIQASREVGRSDQRAQQLVDETRRELGGHPPPPRE